MLSMNNVASSGSALQYFSKDNYYTLDEGLQKSEWFGKGASELGLKGQIKRDDFFSALAGRLDGQVLGRLEIDKETGEIQRKHRPGIDLTFSAPKSVSLLAEVAGRTEVRQAHEDAVKVAVSYVERSLTYTRESQQGAVRTVQSDNVFVALFRHNTSRELDPQTHTHAVVMNATLRPDGRWRSITNEALYRSQHLIGSIYTNELANRLQQLGYTLERKDAKGNFEIKGFTGEQLGEFSKRRTKIVERLDDQGLSVDTATPRQKEVATLDTRSRKVDVDHALLLDNWRTRAQSVELDLDAVGRDKTPQPLAASGKAAKLAVQYAVDHIGEREAVFRRVQLETTALEHSAGKADSVAILREIDRMVEKGALVNLGGDNFATKEILGSERWTLDAVRSEQGRSGSVISSTDLTVSLAQQERTQGFGFTKGQREAITLALTSADRFVAVQGLAGTGKTAMLAGLNRIAKERGWLVRGMAPTGAAAKQMLAESGIAADTVAMFCIKETQLNKDITFARQYASFERGLELWVVDESSFLSQRQTAQLDKMAIRAGAKVVYLGDVKQLQGVEAGKPFELAQDHGIATARMTEISRQKNVQLKEAVSVLVGERSAAAGPASANSGRCFDLLAKQGRVHQVQDQIHDRIAHDYASLPSGVRDQTIVLTAFNQDRIEINALIRGALQARGELSGLESEHNILRTKGWTRATMRHVQYYEPGDVVRFGRDYKRLGVVKGQYLTVQSVDTDAGTVRLAAASPNSAPIIWSPSSHSKIEVYMSELRKLAVGDLVRVTRGEGELKNGTKGRVVSLVGDQAVIALAAGRGEGRITLDLSQSKHWDHAYVSTVHAAQGATAQNVMFYIRGWEGNKRENGKGLDEIAKIFGDRSFYVATTRARESLSVYTDDIAAARALVSNVQNKTSAIEQLNHGLAAHTPKMVGNQARGR